MTKSSFFSGINNQTDQKVETDAIRPEALEKMKAALSKLGPKAYKKVIISYLREAKNRIEQMNQALLHSNSQELQLAAHTLKSSSALVGAAHLSGLCQQLEAQMCSVVENKTNIPLNACEMFSQIQAEYNRVRIALETELAEE